MNATLIRHRHPAVTFGVLVLDTGETFQTLELPWLANQQNVSCIPTAPGLMDEPNGTYEVIRWKSPTRGDCFKVLDVFGREGILIHAGNTAKDTQGCILVGLERGADNASIVHSRAALLALREACPDGMTLRILYA